MSERELLEACIRGEPAAWSELIRRYQDGMAAAAAAALRRARGRAAPADVQDVCQAVLSSLWADGRRRLRSFRGNAPLGSWLSIICARTALNYVRTESRKEGKRFALAASQDVPAPESLRELLDRLPPRQRAAVALRYYEGMRSREIAEALGIESGTVTSILGRAMRELTRMAVRAFLRP